MGVRLAAAACLLLSAFRPAPQSDVEKDLAIEFEIPGEKTFLPGQHVAWSAWLVNRSKDRTHQVIKTGDGSADGMREPFVYFTATRREGEELASSWRRECGFFDADWKKDIIPLKPGEKLPLKDWLHPPSAVFELQKPGPVLIR